MEAPGALNAFSYLTAEKAPLYRAVMRVFMQAKTRFLLHMRPVEVIDALRETDIPIDEVDAELTQLCAWGNLESHHDTAAVQTVDEFYRPRFLFQLTARGEAAEQAVATYLETLQRPGELQTAALGDIRDLLQELKLLSQDPAPDAGKVHRALSTLFQRFDQLTDRAQTFLRSLQRRIDLHQQGHEDFVAYKAVLIDYLERFIGELVVATAAIAHAFCELRNDSERLLTIAADRELIDAVSISDEDRLRTQHSWLARWQGIGHWFIRHDGRPSQAEELRARARAAIPAVLSVVSSINERRLALSDRVTDLRILARWFAECDSDADAHRLWHAAFALTPSRHLRINAETLEHREQVPVPASTSWLEAPPIEISPRLRQSGRYTRRGRADSVIDRSVEKALLLQATADETAQIAAAQHFFIGQGRRRLSDLAPLETGQFNLFLDLLGQALVDKVAGETIVETTSADGALIVRLEPCEDGAFAEIATGQGVFAGPDHFITVLPAYGAA